MWDEQAQVSEFPVPTIDLRRLALLKETKRDRDYSFIAEIARKLPSPSEQMLWSRSARDLIDLAKEHPDLVEQLKTQRPILAFIAQGRDALEAELDAERRNLKRADEDRLAAYAQASVEWTKQWPIIKREIAVLPLKQTHRVLVEHAQILPQQVI